MNFIQPNVDRKSENGQLLFLALIDSLLILSVHIIVVGDTEKGEALLVLCEEELLAFDLQAPRYYSVDISI